MEGLFSLGTLCQLGSTLDFSKQAKTVFFPKKNFRKSLAWNSSLKVCHSPPPFDLLFWDKSMESLSYYFYLNHSHMSWVGDMNIQVLTYWNPNHSASFCENSPLFAIAQKYTVQFFKSISLDLKHCISLMNASQMYCFWSFSTILYSRMVVTSIFSEKEIETKFCENGSEYSCYNGYFWYIYGWKLK